MVTCHFKKKPPENSLLKADGFGVVGREGRRRRWLGEEGRQRAHHCRLGWSMTMVGEGGKMEAENGEIDMVRWGVGCVWGYKPLDQMDGEDVRE